MGFMDRLRKALGGSGTADPGSHAQWIYVQCARCGEPLRSRIDLRNDPSEDDDGTYIVRKGLVGGERRCYQTVEVTIRFSADKSQILDRQISGGRFITEEEFQALAAEQQNPPQEQDEDA